MASATGTPCTVAKRPIGPWTEFSVCSVTVSGAAGLVGDTGVRSTTVRELNGMHLPLYK